MGFAHNSIKYFNRRTKTLLKNGYHFKGFHIYEENTYYMSSMNQPLLKNPNSSNNIITFVTKSVDSQIEYLNAMNWRTYNSNRRWSGYSKSISRPNLIFWIDTEVHNIENIWNLWKLNVSIEICRILEFVEAVYFILNQQQPEISLRRNRGHLTQAHNDPLKYSIWSPLNPQHLSKPFEVLLRPTIMLPNCQFMLTFQSI